MSAITYVTPKLKNWQRDALAKLARDPGAHIGGGTLGFLRRHGLVGKLTITIDGSQKTTSPISPAGLAALDQSK